MVQEASYITTKLVHTSRDISLPLCIQVNTSHIIYRIGDGSMNRSIELVLLVLPLIGLSWKVAQSTDVEPGLYNPVETFNHKIEIESFIPINKTLRASLLNILLAEFEKLRNNLTDKTKCGLLGNWRRVAYFDTTKVSPAQVVFVLSAALQPIRQHVEGLLTLVVPHFNSQLMVTTLMFVVE